MKQLMQVGFTLDDIYYFRKATEDLEILFLGSQWIRYLIEKYHLSPKDFIADENEKFIRNKCKTIERITEKYELSKKEIYPFSFLLHEECIKGVENPDFAKVMEIETLVNQSLKKWVKIAIQLSKITATPLSYFSK